MSQGRAEVQAHPVRVRLSSSSAPRPLPGQLSLTLSVTRLLAPGALQASPWLSGALGEGDRSAIVA